MADHGPLRAAILRALPIDWSDRTTVVEIVNGKNSEGFRVVWGTPERLADAIAAQIEQLPADLSGTDTWPLSDLASPGDLAKHFGVSQQSIHTWDSRYPDFPKPIAHVAASPLYSRRQVVEWRARFLARPGGTR